MKTLKTFTLTAALVATAAIGLAACGGSSSSRSNPSTNSSSAGASTSGAAVSSKRIGGQDVLVTASGMATYFNDQDSGAVRACTGACAKIWVPVAGATLQGHPLYTFVSDGAGKVTGDGVHDSFNGKSFTWHVATKSGSASSGSASPTPAPAPAPTSTGPSSGGYGY